MSVFAAWVPGPTPKISRATSWKIFIGSRERSSALPRMTRKPAVASQSREHDLDEIKLRGLAPG
jgi:hypothetical protein